jgi:hypothetical protein
MQERDTSADTLAFRRNFTGAIFAIFAVGATVSQALLAPLWIRLVLAGVALVGALVALTLFFMEKKARDREKGKKVGILTRTESALALSLSHTEEQGSVWATNQGLHIIEDIEINAIPDDEEWTARTYGDLPRVLADHGTGVDLTYPIPGGWFLARVSKLSPGKSIRIVQYRKSPEDFVLIDVDTRWIDHGGLLRRANQQINAHADDGSIKMTPRENI